MTTIKTILFAGALALGMSACHHEPATTTPAQTTYGAPVGNGAASNNYGTAGTGNAPSAPDVNAQGGATGQSTGGESLANDQAAPGAPSTPGTGTGMQPNGTYGQPGTPGTPGAPGTENPTNPTAGSAGTYGTGSNTIPSAGSGSSAYPYTGSGSNAVPGATGTGTGSATGTGTGMGSSITNPGGTNPATGTTTQP